MGQPIDPSILQEATEHTRWITGGEGNDDPKHKKGASISTGIAVGVTNVNLIGDPAETKTVTFGPSLALHYKFPFAEGRHAVEFSIGGSLKKGSARYDLVGYGKDEPHFNQTLKYGFVKAGTDLRINDMADLTLSLGMKTTTILTSDYQKSNYIKDRFAQYHPDIKFYDAPVMVQQQTSATPFLGIRLDCDFKRKGWGAYYDMELSLPHNIIGKPGRAYTGDGVQLGVTKHWKKGMKLDVGLDVKIQDTGIVYDHTGFISTATSFGASSTLTIPLGNKKPTEKGL